MKATILNFLILLNYTVTYSQTYAKFPERTASWGYMEWGTASNCLNNVCDTELVYQPNIDTIYNATLYHQLLKSGNYFGGLREDTILRKVYYLPPLDSVEHLLYDFTLNVGDTVRSYLFGPDTLDPVTIIQVDSTNQYSLNYRKIFYLSDPAFNWVEGIGSVGGLLAPGFNGIDFSWELICFKVDSIQEYGSSNPYVDCNNITGIREFGQERTIQISPTLLCKGQSIAINGDYSKTPIKLVVSDILGRSIRVIVITSLPYTMPTADFQQGLYHISISSSNSIIETGKFIIMN